MNYSSQNPPQGAARVTGGRFPEDPTGPPLPPALRLCGGARPCWVFRSARPLGELFPGRSRGRPFLSVYSGLRPRRTCSAAPNPASRGKFTPRNCNRQRAAPHYPPRIPPWLLCSLGGEAPAFQGCSPHHVASPVLRLHDPLSGGRNYLK